MNFEGQFSRTPSSTDPESVKLANRNCDTSTVPVQASSGILDVQHSRRGTIVQGSVLATTV
jgi:hypothetical protein